MSDRDGLKSMKSLYWTFEGLSDAQKQAVKELRTSLEDSYVMGHGFFGEDSSLARFLIARGFNVEKAHEMYVNTMNWRKENQVDDILENFRFDEKDEVMRIFPHYYHKLDKKGHPIFFQRLDCQDFGALLQVTNVDRLVRYHIQIWERVIKQMFPAASEAAGRQIFTVTVVVDLKDARLADFFKYKELRDLLKRMTLIDQDNYPEQMGSMMVINTPLLFRTIWKVLKRWMDKRTQEKIIVLGTKFREHLFELCPTDSIPAHFGGSCTCNDMGGCAISNAGPWLDTAMTPEKIEDETPMVFPLNKSVSERFIYTFSGRDYKLDHGGHLRGLSDWGEAVVDEEGDIFVDARDFD